MPKSARKESTCATAGMMRRPPEAPSATRPPSASRAITGHMLQSGRWPGARVLGRPGRGSNHMMPLFIMMPDRGSSSLEPKRDSRVWVSATMLPSRSTTLRCEVQEALTVAAGSPSVPAPDSRSA
jgi:hypothetical protein